MGEGEGEGVGEIQVQNIKTRCINTLLPAMEPMVLPRLFQIVIPPALP